MWSTGAFAGKVAYQYDGLGRLISVYNPNSSRIEYAYDKAGNRTAYFATSVGLTTQEKTAVSGGPNREVAISRNGGTGASYEWFRNGTKIGKTSVPRLVLTTFAPGQAGVYRVVVREASGTVAVVDLTVQIKGLSYESWLQFKEGSTATPKVPGLAKMESARKDGIENLLKYAVGKGPQEAAQAALPTPDWIGAGMNQRLCIKFRRIVAPLDLKIKIEASGDMVKWRDVTAQMSMVGPPLAASDGLSEEVIYQSPVTVSQPEAKDWKFLRIAADGNIPEIDIEYPSGNQLVDGSGAVNLGSIVVGKTGKVATFVIRNSGTVNLTGLALTKNGANASNFIVTAPLKTSLAPGASTTFTAAFKPTAKGSRSAAIHIASNDVDENPFDINLTGIGVPPGPEIEVRQPKSKNLIDGKATRNFGKVTIGAVASKTFTIRNTGTVKLKGLAIKKTGPGKMDFVVTNPPTTTLAPDASTAFKVKFFPNKEGRRNAAIHIKSNDVDENPFDIKLSGEGVNR